MKLLAVFSILLAAAAATEVVGHNATMPECVAAMNGKLPAYYPSGFEFSGNVRKYYIAAEIDEWDYVPSGWDNWLGVPAQESFRLAADGFTRTNETIGTKYDKAVYREYTDATFTQKADRPDWLGLQGPILRAEVGDMIEILFVNKIQDYVANIHSMGLFYSKENEGSVYYNTSKTCGPGDSVYYSHCFVYKWLVTNDLAPPSGDLSRLLGYHAFVSMPQDTDTGLYGSNIIYARGKMEEVMSQNREYVLTYSMQDEKNSFLVKQNVEKYLPGYYNKMVTNAVISGNQYPGTNWSYWDPQSINDPFTGNLRNACGTFYAINGYAFSNNPPFEMCLGDQVIWYVYNMGDAPHAVHWHGNNVVMDGTKVPTVPSHPGIYETRLMNAVNPGIWQILCHYNVHNTNGMDALYRVYDAGQCPLEPLSTANEKKRFFAWF